ncbi:palmitoyl thioesterase [Trichoderma cornu-damae]|uniref:Palmitoyl-protein thioesterase 1 n=1 Tax=Trichoderma cornu-damae TaxID=654480 RepID=A0A9P8TUW8_9HYPO|nr:palmitoyl thioesterase [Trichoderma cornu-damae]
MRPPPSLLLTTVLLASRTLGWKFSHQTADDEGDDTPLPVVIWHGLGDAFDSEGIREVGELADEIHPGTFVHAIALGADANSDRSATFFGNVTEQLETVCAALAAHPILSTAPAVDAIGFSQGGQFLRGYVERCNNPPVRSLITFGSQHTGITEFKTCGTTEWLCKGAMALLKFNTWSRLVQGRLVPAQYYRNLAKYDSYLESSNFLADINNERPLKNEQYGKNVASLANFVMYVFEDDTTVVPKQSAWFTEVNGTEITPLRKQTLYKEDWIGLRQLDERGGLRFRSITGEHMQITAQVLKEAISEFFGPANRAFSPETDADQGLRQEEL